jgi:hypothetical protein
MKKLLIAALAAVTLTLAIPAEAHNGYDEYGRDVGGTSFGLYINPGSLFEPRGYDYGHRYYRYDEPYYNYRSYRPYREYRCNRYNSWRYEFCN